VAEIVISVTPWILGTVLLALIAGLLAITLHPGQKRPT